MHLLFGGLWPPLHRAALEVHQLMSATRAGDLLDSEPAPAPAPAAPSAPTAAAPVTPAAAQTAFAGAATGSPAADILSSLGTSLPASDPFSINFGGASSHYAPAAQQHGGLGDLLGGPPVQHGQHGAAQPSAQRQDPFGELARPAGITPTGLNGRVAMASLGSSLQWDQYRHARSWHACLGRALQHKVQAAHREELHAACGVHSCGAHGSCSSLAGPPRAVLLAAPPWYTHAASAHEPGLLQARLQGSVQMGQAQQATCSQGCPSAATGPRQASPTLPMCRADSPAWAS